MSITTTAPNPARELSAPKAALIAALMLSALLVAEWMRPTERLAEKRERIQLATQVPAAFGDWREDKAIQPVLPNPEVQAKLDVLYSQLLARTYVNSRGERIMLSIAYGSDQSSEATAVHRPEFCYSAQGFRVRGAGQASLSVQGRPLQVQRLVASMPPRVEPITYWVTLDEVATLPGLDRKLAQLRYGLRGQIPDGMLVRVSNISSDEAASFELQNQFLQQLRQALPAGVAPRYFGS
jgi:EpsI family protein